MLVDKYRGYMSLYTERTAEQTSRRQHLMFLVHSGSISHLLHVLASGGSLPQLLLFSAFLPSALRQPGEQHVCLGNEISKSLLFSQLGFFVSSLLTFKFIFRVNRFSVACYIELSP